MTTPAQEGARAGLDLGALDAITDAVESGAGLPEVIRAAARALEASLVLSDHAGHVLAVAARSTSDEQAMLAGREGVEAHELRVADVPVGTLRVRERGEADPVLLRLVLTLVASEVERLRAPERASAEAAEAFLRALLGRELLEAGVVLARAEELGLDLADGASVLVVRAHALVAADEGRRARVLALVERAARAAVPGAIAALTDRHELPGDEVVTLLPGGSAEVAERAADGVRRELQAGLSGHTFTIGRSRPCADAGELHRAANEALLAANVAEGDPERPVLAFEETGAYRLLLSAMAEDPAELQRFYAETVEPLVAYDEQYETDLVTTVTAFLEADGNIAGTAQRLFTHRHTIRYRLERVRELSGLDVGSTDGREKLSLGLKAMRVLGIAHRGGPATEAGAGAGRVPPRAR
ncbi:MAG: helix-turn-helix domain-containing protein [Solirubrobacteraceae bacterium]|jgi:sugar diacid utilization regulator|nr:helix-turn-helix domain-containing protein [Solirubrobacteraceae bacterium]